LFFGNFKMNKWNPFFSITHSFWDTSNHVFLFSIRNLQILKSSSSCRVAVRLRLFVRFESGFQFLSGSSQVSSSGLVRPQVPVMFHHVLWTLMKWILAPSIIGGPDQLIPRAVAVWDSRFGRTVNVRSAVDRNRLRISFVRP
jgi:hypothetical protein